MCGIVGLYSYNKLDGNSRNYINWCLGTMQRRGPDSFGIWESDNRNYLAGFNRLAIRDLSESGNQPMVSADSKYCISFNGEIYNVAFLKKKLSGINIRFRSSSDTEILMNLLIYFPVEQVLSWIDGMFAFAFFNQKTNELILARDRVGIKPLYIGQSNKGILYSSQYDHIINHEWFKNQSFDYENIGLYLQLGYFPSGHGVKENTKMFPHGHYLKIAPNGITWHKYYEIPQRTVVGGDTKELLEKITVSVKNQMVSDVPLGTFMSGGTDSPLLTYIINQIDPVESFTIGIKDSASDESVAAQKYADIFGNKHHCQMINETDFLQQLDANFTAYSEPFADYSSIPTLVLAGFAKKKITVALSGDGPDELLWGYSRNTKMLQQGLLFKQFRWKRTAQLLLRKTLGIKNASIKRHIETDNFTQFYYRSLFITGAEYGLSKIYKVKPKVAQVVVEYLQTNPEPDLSLAGIMDTVRKLEMELHLQRILLKVDRASMYHSLEVRVPYLSNNLLDFFFQFSYKQCINEGIGKMPLKEILAQKTNKELVFQPKKGFIIPIDQLIQVKLKKDIKEKILDMPSELKEAFISQKLESFLNDYFDNKRDCSWMVWAIYCLVNWYDYHYHR